MSQLFNVTFKAVKGENCDWCLFVNDHSCRFWFSSDNLSLETNTLFIENYQSVKWNWMRGYLCVSKDGMWYNLFRFFLVFLNSFVISCIYLCMYLFIYVFIYFYFYFFIYLFYVIFHLFVPTFNRCSCSFDRSFRLFLLCLILPHLIRYSLRTYVIADMFYAFPLYKFYGPTNFSRELSRSAHLDNLQLNIIVVNYYSNVPRD